MDDSTTPEVGAARDPLVGTLIADRYRLEAALARGGMARVYRARDTRLERDVAVKILSSPYREDPAFVSRFLAEARAAASISHPSLVHVYDSGSDGDTNFIVMELLDRHRSLRQELDARGTLPRHDVLRIGRELLAGLRVVHDRGLVHCDVKPANVMLGPGPAKLIDFGIARTPNVGLEGQKSIGSLHFMSPEQLHGEPLTPASDLFALGAVLYEALTGSVPYGGSTPEEVSARHAASGVRPPSTLVGGVPAQLDVAILQALRADPRQRFDSAAAMDAALAAAGDQLTESRAEETSVHRPVARAVVPPAATTGRGGGYVPPPMEPERQAPRPMRPPPPPPPRHRRDHRGRLSNTLGMLGTLAVLAAAALLVIFIVVPLLQLGSGSSGAGSPSATQSAERTPAPGMVFVPDTVGMATGDAIQAARAAGLGWTVYCNQDAEKPAGIIAQEPQPSAEVRIGSSFAMYSARIADCPGDD